MFQHLCRLFAVVSSLSLVSCDQDESIVVVGAGLAGLAAASRLVQAGYSDVIVLGASDRVGGRMKRWEDSIFSNELIAASILVKEDEKNRLIHPFVHQFVLDMIKSTLTYIFQVLLLTVPLLKSGLTSSPRDQSLKSLAG